MFDEGPSYDVPDGRGVVDFFDRVIEVLSVEVDAVAEEHGWNAPVKGSNKARMRYFHAGRSLAHATAQLLKHRLASEVDRSTGRNIQAECSHGLSEKTADEHIVVAEVLEYELAHVGCRHPLAAVVDHAEGSAAPL